MNDNKDEDLNKISNASTGLWSKSKLNKKFPELKDKTDKIEILQKNKQYIRKVNQFAPIVASATYSSIQIDLMDMSNYSRLNKGIKYLMCIIDVYSRYAFVYPLKNKTTIETSKYLNEWLNKINH